MVYDPSNTTISGINYMVAEAGDPWFIPAYPTILEEQRDEDEFFSLNGELNAAGTERDLTTGIQWTEARFDAYKAAALASCNNLVGTTAQAVVPASNLPYEVSKGSGVPAE